MLSIVGERQLETHRILAELGLTNDARGSAPSPRPFRWPVRITSGQGAIRPAKAVERWLPLRPSPRRDRVRTNNRGRMRPSNSPERGKPSPGGGIPSTRERGPRSLPTTSPKERLRDRMNPDTPIALPGGAPGQRAMMAVRRWRRRDPAAVLGAACFAQKGGWDDRRGRPRGDADDAPSSSTSSAPLGHVRAPS